jgi:hypothetical protein
MPLESSLQDRQVSPRATASPNAASGHQGRGGVPACVGHIAHPVTSRTRHGTGSREYKPFVPRNVRERRGPPAPDCDRQITEGVFVEKGTKKYTIGTETGHNYLIRGCF